MRSRLRSHVAAAFAVLGVALVACGDEAGPAASAVDAAELPIRPRGAEVVTPRMGAPLADGRVAEILALLQVHDADAADRRAALDEIVANQDVRFVAVLIEMLRAGLLGLGDFDTEYVETLQTLAQVNNGVDWADWLEWYGFTELEPVPGFATWKGELYASIDPRFTELLNDEHPSTIRVEEIAWGGVAVDGIRPLDRPPVLAGVEATYLEPTEPVFGVTVNGESRAYPLRIMDPHEMANDVLGGVPITLAYCTLCGAGIAYKTTQDDGTVLTFSTSGLLHESNKLMYDRETSSLWSQFTGRPVVGELVRAAEGRDEPLLTAIPIVVASWESWLAGHPETTVLDLNTGVGFGYTLGYPYLDYFSSGETLFPVSERSGQLRSKDWVFGLSLDGKPKAYALDALALEPVLDDTLAGREIVVIMRGAIIDVSAEAPIVGTVTYEAGGEVLAFERPEGVTFVRQPSGDTLEDEDGALWRITDEALVASDGRAAARVAGHNSFWFGWFQHFPRTEVYGAREPIE